MALYTNTKEQVLHAGGVMLIPATAVDLPDDLAKLPMVQRWIKEGRLVQGEVEVPAEVEQPEGKPPLKNASPNERKA